MKDEVITRLKNNSNKGEELIAFLQNEINRIKGFAMEKAVEKIAANLREENAKLKEEVKIWQAKVIELETMNNIKQYPLPSESICLKTSEVKDKQIMEPKETNNSVPNKVIVTDEVPKKQAKKEKEVLKKEKPAKGQKSENQVKEDDQEISVSRLDLRVGFILTAKKHPDAESLYVEEIDVGEEKSRTVVSGLVKFVPLEEMQNRFVVVLCNLKPAKMRGVMSEAMVMCASTPEKVEILCPPEGSIPGNRVTCNDFPGTPDSLLPPKKKIFEQVAPDLKTNNDCIATYKSCPLQVLDKGFIKSQTLIGAPIK